MYTELENDEIDGIFMDRNRAVHSLQEINKSRFMVFSNVFKEISYFLAVPGDDSGLKGLLDDNSCFKKHIDIADIDNLLLRYLQPVKVTATCLII